MFLYLCAQGEALYRCYACIVEESPDRKEHCTVESTGRRKFTLSITEKNHPFWGKGENVG